MDLTSSYQRVMPPELLSRYEFDETRNAAAVLMAAHPDVFEHLVKLLTTFELYTSDLTSAGRNESPVAHRLNDAVRVGGFREAALNSTITLDLVLRPFRPAGERAVTTQSSVVESSGYQVDGFLDRVAVDVEWNAKDGNLDRDLGAYRAFYEWALIDVAVVISRTHEDLRDLAYSLRLDAGMDPEEAWTMLRTSTTTNRNKLQPKLQRGASGGCPVLAVYICERTWESYGSGAVAPAQSLPPAPEDTDEETLEVD